MTEKVNIEDLITRINKLPSIDKYLIKRGEESVYLNSEGLEIPIDIIMSTPEIGIMIVHMPNGKFPLHNHPYSIEFGLIMEGDGYGLVAYQNGETKRYDKGEVFVFQKNVVHEWTNIGSCSVLFITIPKDEGYP